MDNTTVEKGTDRVIVMAQRGDSAPNSLTLGMCMFMDLFYFNRRE